VLARAAPKVSSKKNDMAIWKKDMPIWKIDMAISKKRLMATPVGA
jgi:hypothetical protein